MNDALGITHSFNLPYLVKNEDQISISSGYSPICQGKRSMNARFRRRPESFNPRLMDYKVRKWHTNEGLRMHIYKEQFINHEIKMSINWLLKKCVKLKPRHITGIKSWKNYPLSISRLRKPMALANGVLGCILWLLYSMVARLAFDITTTISKRLWQQGENSRRGMRRM